MLPKGSLKNLKGRVIFFATKNFNKFNEARRVLAEYNIAVGMLKIKSLEIQSDSIEEVAGASAVDAFEKCHLPIIVEDAGLFVDALKGFPGPYAAYIYKTIGNQGLLTLMKHIEDRRARFESAVAYFVAGLRSPRIFHGEVRGEISNEEKRSGAKSSFGFDPVFAPNDSSKTFAQMNIAEKNRYSHRARAFRNFAEWYSP